MNRYEQFLKTQPPRASDAIFGQRLSPMEEAERDAIDKRDGWSPISFQSDEQLLSNLRQHEDGRCDRPITRRNPKERYRRLLDEAVRRGLRK